MRKVTVDAAAPILLTKWLKTQFPFLAKGVVAAALKDRDIRVNGKRMGDDVELHDGDEVELYIGDAKLDGPTPEIVWLSENMIVAVKPAGILAKGEGEADMERRVAEWLEKRGEPPVALACHRLDNQTGGLMMFARNPGAEAAARAMMESQKILKTYRCIVKGTPGPARAVLTAYMKKDAARAYVTVLDRPAPGARTAVTEYAVLASDGSRSLLEVTLHTGRTHQIRAHLAHIGHPILGDDKYGDRAFNRLFKAPRQKLWACRLEFRFTADECPVLADLAGRMLEVAAPFDGELDR